MQDHLLKNAAFLSVTLEDLRQDINENGIKEQYQNGVNQAGFKDSVETKTYNSLLKTYISIIKQLSDMLPSGNENEKDEFDKFCDDEE